MRVLFHRQATPRILLFYLAILGKIAASALSAVGFVLKSAPAMIAGTIVWLIFFAVLLAVALPGTDRFFRDGHRWLRYTAGAVIVVLLLAGIAQSVLTSLVGLQSIYGDNSESNLGRLFLSLDKVFAYNDATSLSHQAADNFIEGKNPYAEANIVTAGIKYDIAPDKLTPLREGRLADAFPYPEMARLESLWQEAIRHPDQVPPELESRFNYPAGDFLLPALFIRLGVEDIRIIYLILILPALVYTVIKVPRDLRIFFLIALLASLELWNSLAAGETGFLYFPFILLAWLLYKRNLWLSALFLGVAVAIKQIAWFIIPFYFIVVLRTMGIKKLLLTVLIIAGVFFAANAPFLVQDPGLWLKSIIAPLTDRMFPLGVGVISLVSGGVLDIRSPLVFSILEIIIGAAAIVWYFLNCRRYPDTGPVLAVLPLFFAWRSLWGYFFYVDIIVLAAIMINEYGRNTTGITENMAKV
ncbi:MAG: hypothetical protein A2Z29_04820 [Chloroflexi bacterium RBG_16_56_11]|nr:MAG: hypothetical protein A2Z29_04820 [Chloroflexi bacterium RBG_16_56_11]